MADEQIKKLSDYQHARLKTNMYSGSKSLHSQDIIFYNDGEPEIKEFMWTQAVYTSFREILDNALDELAHGYGNRIDVKYDEKTMTFSVQDNGRGIPIKWDKQHGCHLATLVLSTARSGRNFGDRQEVAGTNGLGCAITNFCSQKLKLEIWRDGKIFTQYFKEGKNELLCEDPLIKKYTSDKVGTRITFTLSKEVFPQLVLPEEFVYSRLYEVALCNPLLKIYYNGTRIKVKPTAEKSIFTKKKTVVIEINERGFRSKFILQPDFQKSGEHVHSIVNNIPTLNGGTHIETFRRLFYAGLINALARESKKRKLQPNRTDINDGLLIFNITNMNAPDFDSQSKTRLVNEEVVKIIKDHLENDKVFKSIINKNKDWINEIYERCAKRTQKKDDSETSKKARKLLRNKVPDLKDATNKDRSKCILFLAEGQSAISGMTEVRDPEIHGGLGLRGKVLNVNGEKPARVLDSEMLVSVMNSVGLIIGEKSIKGNLRYGKVYIAHDADEDGKNIGALLINFFYTYWPELFDKDREPYFYIFNTPYVIAEKGKERKYWYSRNYEEFNPKDYKGWSITRAKGLAALSREDWMYSLVNPDLYAIVDDGKLEESLDLIFSGKRADDRKEWISL